jgi:protein gp37
MSENSKIQWCDDTYNPWRGCTKVSAGCKNCYAEKLITTRLAHVHYDAATAEKGTRSSKKFFPTSGGATASVVPLWGEGSPRIRAVDLNEPLRWNKKPSVCNYCGKAFAVAQGHECVVPRHGIQDFHRRRVFSLSLGDWLDEEVPIDWFVDFLHVVFQCQNLDWLLVTKRADKYKWMIRMAQALDCQGKREGFPKAGKPSAFGDWLLAWVGGNPPPHVMLLASVENQEAADERIPELLRMPAARRGLSCEPLLGLVTLESLSIGNLMPDAPGIDWVIVGGESGPAARPCNVDWIREIKDQCNAAGVPCFVKQMGVNTYVPAPFGPITGKGDKMDEWPEDLRQREFYK